jgi:hypothetical protein
VTDSRTSRDWAGDPIGMGGGHRNAPQAETNDPKIRKLLGPKGEVLRTFSDKPPVGFHQGQRTHP